jgi:hypothetical protein
MTDYDLDFDADFDELTDLDADGAAELELRIAALEREGGVEAAFQAAMREELAGEV